MIASLNARNTDGRSGGRSKPSVRSDEPLVVNALRQPWFSSPAKMHAYATKTMSSEMSGSASSANGAYIAKTRSRAS